MEGYIIGNGFDLSHGMSTKYSDFYKYLKKHDQKNIGGFEYFYDCEQENLWGNFEDNMIVPKIKELFDIGEAEITKDE